MIQAVRDEGFGRNNPKLDSRHTFEKKVCILKKAMFQSFILPWKERADCVNKKRGLHCALWIKNELTPPKMPLN